MRRVNKTEEKGKFEEEETAEVTDVQSSDIALEDLPREMLLSILSFLPFHVLLQMMLVNKQFLTLAEDNVFWKSVWERYKQRGLIEDSKTSAATDPGHYFNTIKGFYQNLDPIEREIQFIIDNKGETETICEICDLYNSYKELLKARRKAQKQASEVTVADYDKSIVANTELVVTIILEKAIEIKQPKLFKTVLKEFLPFHGGVLLRKVVKKGHTAYVQILLEQKAVNPNSQPALHEESTLLGIAAKEGLPNCVRALLEEGGVNPHIKDRIGRVAAELTRNISCQCLLHIFMFLKPGETGGLKKKVKLFFHLATTLKEAQKTDPAFFADYIKRIVENPEILSWMTKKQWGRLLSDPVVRSLDITPDSNNNNNHLKC